MLRRTALLLASLAALAVAGPSYANGEVLVIAWDNFTLTQEGEWMVEFYAPWCPACRQFESDWESFAYRSEDYDVNVAKVDISKQTMLSGRFMVTHLPTVFHIINAEVRYYEGERNVNDLMDYIREKQWKDTEPITYWKSPTAPHMYVVGGLFYVSEVAKQWQETLEKDYNIPTYGVFGLLAVATIVVGLSLGGITVCVIEMCIRLCSSSNNAKRPSKSGSQPRAKKSPAAEASAKPTPEQQQQESASSKQDASPKPASPGKDGARKRKKKDGKGDKDK